jgi:hypothetical protein
MRISGHSEAFCGLLSSLQLNTHQSVEVVARTEACACVRVDDEGRGSRRLRIWRQKRMFTDIQLDHMVVALVVVYVR